MNENDERNEIIKAAEQGDAIDQYNLATMHDYGENMEQSDEAAKKWGTGSQIY
jgi:TPR repeat protein